TLMRSERSEVRGDTGLVVGGAPPVQPVTALGRFERRRVPERVIALGLYVVVRVQQYGRRSGRRGMMSDHRWRTPGLGDDADLGETGIAEQLGNRIGTALHLVSTVGIGPHRLDTDEILEIGTYGRQNVGDLADERFRHDRHPI